jgi:hypothetical protein
LFFKTRLATVSSPITWSRSARSPTSCVSRPPGSLPRGRFCAPARSRGGVSARGPSCLRGPGIRCQA